MGCAVFDSTVTNIHKAFHVFAMYSDLFYVHSVFSMCSSKCQQTHTLLEDKILLLDKKLVANSDDRQGHAKLECGFCYACHSEGLLVDRGSYQLNTTVTVHMLSVFHTSAKEMIICHPWQTCGLLPLRLHARWHLWMCCWPVSTDKGKGLVNKFSQKLVCVAGVERAAQLQSLLCRGLCSVRVQLW
jgi:hypothetical protein